MYHLMQKDKDVLVQNDNQNKILCIGFASFFESLREYIQLPVM